jgi:hypothetical protein
MIKITFDFGFNLSLISSQYFHIFLVLSYQLLIQQLKLVSLYQLIQFYKVILVLGKIRKIFEYLDGIIICLRNIFHVQC